MFNHNNDNQLKRKWSHPKDIPYPQSNAYTDEQSDNLPIKHTEVDTESDYLNQIEGFDTKEDYQTPKTDGEQFNKYEYLTKLKTSLTGYALRNFEKDNNEYMTRASNVESNGYDNKENCEGSSTGFLMPATGVFPPNCLPELSFQGKVALNAGNYPMNFVAVPVQTEVVNQAELAEKEQLIRNLTSKLDAATKDIIFSNKMMRYVDHRHLVKK